MRACLSPPRLTMIQCILSIKHWAREWAIEKEQHMGEQH